MTADTALPAHLTVVTSDRGFDSLPTIPSVYGGEVAVSESSGASNQYLWLRAEAPVDLNRPDGERVEAPMHLVVEDALRLADQLVYLVANHYQFVNSGDFGAALRLRAERVTEAIAEALQILAEADTGGDEVESSV